MTSNYLRNFAIAVIAASTALAPVVMEIKQDLKRLKSDLVFAQDRLSQLENALFFIAANSQSGDRVENIRELERSLERQSPYKPREMDDNVYEIELTITYPKIK